MDEAKKKWLADIGAVAYLEPVKYIYKFPEGYETFGLTERYVEDTALEELKAKYDRDYAFALEPIALRKSRAQNQSYYELPRRVCIAQSISAFVQSLRRRRSPGGNRDGSEHPPSISRKELDDVNRLTHAEFEQMYQTLLSRRKAGAHSARP